jgi:hypothetical protein
MTVEDRAAGLRYYQMGLPACLHVAGIEHGWRSQMQPMTQQATDPLAGGAGSHDFRWETLLKETVPLKANEYDNEIARIAPNQYQRRIFMSFVTIPEFAGLSADDPAFWQSESKFQKQSHWLRHSFAVRWLGNPEGLEDAVRSKTASCGPMSFAAITGCSARAALACFPSPSIRLWTNRTDMERALFEAGYDYDRKQGDWPKAGLCLIQFTGPWTERGFAQAALKHTHWIAILGEYVFDINWGGWLPRGNWEDVVLEELLMFIPKTTGWRVLTSYELPVDTSWYRRLQTVVS